MKILFWDIIRNFKTNKLSTPLNITGLVIGLSCCILLALYVQHELSYDTFHKDKGDICRVIHVSSRNSKPFATTPYILAPTFRNNIPEIEEFVRIEFMGDKSTFIKYNEKEFNEQKIIATDPSFFQFFSFKYLKGSEPQEVLSSTDQILISEKIATKYFGKENPVGKSLTLKSTWMGEHKLSVAGIFEDFPTNSHVLADIIFPLDWNKKDHAWMLNNWGANSLHTYIKLASNTDTETINKKIPEVLEIHAGSINKNGRADFHKQLDYYLQPLGKIYLFSSDISGTSSLQKGSYSKLIIFGTIAILILLIAIVNFILLSLSETNRKFKTTAIRKLSGASNPDIFKQIIREFFGLFVVSLFITFLVIIIILPYYNSFLNKTLSINNLSGYSLFFAFLSLTLVLGIIASGYIANTFSGKNVLKMLTDKAIPGSSSNFMRKGLLAFQIGTFVILLISSLYINKQLNYINSKDLGFEKESLLSIEHSCQLSEFPVLKEELLRNPSIKSVSGSTISPITGGSWKGNIIIKEKDINQQVEVLFTDEDFLKTFEMKLLEGYDFREKSHLDKNESIIINETAAKQLGLEEQTVGHFIDWSGFVSGKRKIIGIVKDFHMHNMYEEIMPLALIVNTNQLVQTISLKVHPGDIAQTINYIRSVWDRQFPGKPFVFSFADQALEQAYIGVSKTQTIINIFTSLAVFVACLGLFGMALFAAQQRTKEIGIRKVNGAKISEILSMLNKDFVKWVAIAFVIACPIAWYAMSKWLENFAYKTTLSWWVFALAGLLALGIALLTVSWQSWRAATRNPVEALRYE